VGPFLNPCGHPPSRPPPSLPFSMKEHGDADPFGENCTLPIARFWVRNYIRPFCSVQSYGWRRKVTVPDTRPLDKSLVPFC